LGGPQGPSVTVLRSLIHGLRELHLEWRPLLESCGIDPDLIADPDARIPVDVFDRFWPKAAELTGDPCFGLHVAERLRPLAVNILGYLLMSSSTVRDGLERVARYQRLVFDATWIALVDRGSSTLIRFETANANPLHVAVQIEYRAALVLKILDWITAVDFRAGEVRFRHRPAGDRSEYERILGCPVKFQCSQDELVVSRASLDQPSVYSNPEIARLHQEHAERHLAELDDHSVSRGVKTILMSHLDRGPFELSEVARSLHMSTRTLQRRLADEGTCYNELLDSLRRDLCLEHLERPHTSLAEIAYVAGFSDTSAFSRAVRRWTGQTPLEHRRSHLEAASSADSSA
jgi:AraC-like DNA-binding protein